MIISISNDFVFPKCPQELCFNANEFIKDSFSVDQFLQDHRKKANLEIMRDDLGIYLKTLRSAMIELINKDYAEFISLSTNLVDLDKRLDNIQSPISQLENYILQTQEKLVKTNDIMSNLIQTKKQLKLQKQVLASIKHIEESMKILNQLQNNDEESVVLERIISEITFIQFHIKSCKGKPEFEKVSSNWEALQQSLMNKLKYPLLTVYTNKDTTKVSSFITALSNLTNIEYVEKLVSHQILAPILDDLITEDSLSSDPRSLEGLHGRILLQVDCFKELFDTIENDFLTHCMFPQILSRFINNVKSIFAPGNADTFHRRFRESFKFLDQLEDRCKDEESVKYFRNSEEYIQFTTSWNVAVYFSLRCRNIVGKLEMAFDKLNLEVDSKKPCQLFVTSEIWACIESCWSDQVLLPPVTRRLWKLTLQIVSRYCTFCDDTIKNDWSESTLSKPLFLVSLNSDIKWLENNLKTLVFNLSRKLNLFDKKYQCLEGSLAEGVLKLNSKIALTEEKIVDLISQESLTHIRSVNDIPRHFRRTNREMPSQPSTYVNLLVAAPLKFMTDVPVSKEWLKKIFSKITKEYFSSVREVITSVQRTEESLRRFKKIREKSVGDNTKSGGVGDEEKIKQQISLDVKLYQSIVLKTGLKIDDVENLSDIVNIVEKSLLKQPDE